VAEARDRQQRMKAGMTPDKPEAAAKGGAAQQEGAATEGAAKEGKELVSTA
jgi:hypothetical protein